MARTLANSPCLEGFEVQEVIAESGAAIVYLAIDGALRMPVAIKEYLPQRLARRDAESRIVPLSPAQAAAFERGLRAFVNEARLLARCDHPSLLRVVRLLEANGTAYSVMPHYVGDPLAEVRQGMSVAPDEASLRALLEHLLGALEAFHRIGGVHGNVTPGNILMLDDDRPLLLGPGAASDEVRDDRIEALMAYLKPTEPPGDPIDEGPMGPWTDLHGLAKVARFCITGGLPAEAASTAGIEPLSDLLRQSGRGSALPHYSAAFLDALDAAASPLAHLRPQSAAQFREWLAHGPPSGIPMPASRDGRPGAALPTEPIPSATLHDNKAATLAAAGPFAIPRAPEPESPSPDRSPPRRALPQDPMLDPEFVQQPVQAGGEPESVTRRIAGAQDTRRGGSAPDAPQAPAASGFDPGPRRRRRFGLWSGVAIGIGAVLLVGGAWVLDQRPVRIDGWAQELSTTVSGSAGHAAKPVETAGIDRPGAAVPPSGPPPGDRASMSVAPDPVVDTASPEANVAGVPEMAGDAPVVTARSVAPGVESVRAAAPPASQLAAPDQASLASIRPAQPVQRAARAAPQQAIAQVRSSPHEACAGRTQFARYRCMQSQCSQPRWGGHAQCERLRATDQID